MTTFYDNLKTTATATLTKFGADVQFLSADSEGNVTVIAKAKGVMGVLKAENLPSSLTASATALLYVSAPSRTPLVDDYIKFNGVTYKVVYVEETNPAGTAILYGLYLTK